MLVWFFDEEISDWKIDLSPISRVRHFPASFSPLRFVRQRAPKSCEAKVSRDLSGIRTLDLWHASQASYPLDRGALLLQVLRCGCFESRLALTPVCLVSFEDNATKTSSAYQKLVCSASSFKSGLIHSINIIDMIGGYLPPESRFCDPPLKNRGPCTTMLKTFDK